MAERKQRLRARHADKVAVGEGTLSMTFAAAHSSILGANCAKFRSFNAGSSACSMSTQHSNMSQVEFYLVSESCDTSLRASVQHHKTSQATGMRCRD